MSSVKWYQARDGWRISVGPSDNSPYTLSVEEAQAVADLVAAGPPQPKYRITRDFDYEPSYVSGAMTGGLKAGSMLAAGDIEEVWPE